VIKPRPEYIIIGTGKEYVPIEDYKLKHLREVLGIKVDVVATVSFILAAK
jgi:predicted transcriptional regulator